MKNLNEDDLESYVIDLGANRKKEMNESFLRMFGGAVQAILERMFGGSQVPVTVRGTKSEIESFARTLDRERNYMNAYKQYGLDDPRTYKNKYQLNKAVSEFTRKTGIQWPFK